MKLFRSLLIAPAALGLMSPLAVSASETNLNEISNYSDVETIDFANSFGKTDSNQKQLLAGGEGLVDSDSYNHSHDGGFSETTSLTGAAFSQIGSVDKGNNTDALTATYSYNLDLNTSFTGEDNLYVGIETGNSTASVDFRTGDSVNGSDELSVASMYYQFPVGNYDIAVGPLLDNDDLMPTTTTIYSDKFFMSGYRLFKSNPWLYDRTGAGVAVSRNFDNGFNASGSIIGTEAATSDGFLTEQGADVITLSAGYDGDSFGGGIVYVSSDGYCDLVNDLLSSTCSDLGITSDISADTVGIGGYWTPNDGQTTVSATINSVDPDISGITTDEFTDVQFALEHEFGAGVLSASWKSIPLLKISGSDLVNDTLGSYYEIYFTQPINDSLDLTYGVAVADPDTDSDDTVTLSDYSAVGAQATWKF